MTRLNSRLPQQLENRLVCGAYRYAKAENSDPFALDRALSHIANGVCGCDERGRDIGYEARPTSETRTYTLNGVTHDFKLEVFRDQVRP